MAIEKTFTSFNKDQGANYAQNRPGYHPNLYKTIIDHHASHGGQFDTILDVGCGPGVAARALAPHFAHVTGIDPSEGMINNARTLAGESSTPRPIRFEIASAEDLGSHLSPPVEDGSIDLLTASMAAHWFDMARFWPQAARILKPRGTVAIWCTGSITVHPSMPNATAIEAAITDFKTRELMPFFEPGNLMTRELYASMPLPWTLSPPIAEFHKATFFRKEYGPGNSEDEFFVNGGLAGDLERMERVLGTMSPVQRWRDAYPEAVGTEGDVVRRLRRDIERLLNEAGVEKEKQTVKVSLTGVLLMVTKA